MKDYSIRITYSVFQTRGELKNSTLIRLIGKYDCKCVAEDIVEYMKTQHLVKCFITRKVEEL